MSQGLLGNAGLCAQRACAPQPWAAAGGDAHCLGGPPRPRRERLSPGAIPIGTLGEDVTLRGSRVLPLEIWPCSPYAQQSSRWAQGSAHEKRGLPMAQTDPRLQNAVVTALQTSLLGGWGVALWRARLPGGFFKQGHAGQSSGSSRQLCAHAAILHSAPHRCPSRGTGRALANICWAAGPSHAQLNDETHFSFEISTPLPLSRICPSPSQPNLGFGQVYVTLGLWKPQTKPKWNGEGPRRPPPATACL